MDAKKSFLDQAAYEIFAEKGYKNTNISEIAKKAGMAVGSFYKFYSSKEEIFLQIYVRENDRVRSKLMEEVNWQREPVQVIDDLFTYTFDAVLNNRILNEWNNPSIAHVLHDYYYSEKGVENYTFHHFLLKTFEERLNQTQFSEEKKKEFLKVYDLIYYIDTHMTENDFKGYSESLGVLVKYFIKGLFS